MLTCSFSLSVQSRAALRQECPECALLQTSTVATVRCWRASNAATVALGAHAAQVLRSAASIGAVQLRLSTSSFDCRGFVSSSSALLCIALTRVHLLTQCRRSSSFQIQLLSAHVVACRLLQPLRLCACGMFVPNARRRSSDHTRSKCVEPTASLDTRRRHDVICFE